MPEFCQDPTNLLFKCRICPITGDPWMTTKRLKEHAKTKRHEKSQELKAKSRKAAHKCSSSGACPTAHACKAGFPEPDATPSPTDAGQSCDGNPDLPNVHSPIEHTTDLSADPFVQFEPDLTSSEHGELPEEFSRRGWTDPSGQRIFFSAGSEESDPLAESLARALRGAHNEETIEQTTYTEDLAREDPLFCPDAPDSDGITAEELNSRLFGPDANSEWFPYLDKAAFLTDVLFSSPRLRFSRAQQKVVLSWAKDLEANVPSYGSFRKTQDTLLAEVGDPTKRQQSGRGNVWICPIRSRAGMTLYPEDGGNKLGEVWHGDKMLRDIPDHLLSLTVRYNGVIYYVNELVKLEGRWFLPKRWLTRNSGKVMLASGHHVTNSDLQAGLVVDDSTLDVVEVLTFLQNFIQILDDNSGIYLLSAQSDVFAAQMPHSLREKAGLRMVYSIPLAVFINNVSGNKSKQWNKHFSCYMSNGALPRTKLENKFHVRFVATSPFTSPLEIMQGVRASIEETFSEPIVAWDCEAKEEVLLCSYGLLFAGDNPMQAELCSCAGLNTNVFCRTCKAGGTREWKQSNEGFAQILKPGIRRASADTAEETFQQILTAFEPNVATTLTEAVRASGVKDALAQPIIDLLIKMGQDLRKPNPDGTSHSPDEIQTILTEELKKHQQKGIDMHKDTPTEILHTVLLGVVKYYWGDYMCQYRGGLIGKHFKTLSQIMAFAVQDLVPPDVLEAWLIMGRLTVLLWHTEIEDISTYTCFGPAVLFSTERYEAYNAVFHACSIYSNCLTPSWDIAWSFVGIDGVKHIVTGGWWRDSRTGVWTCAKPRVLQHILDHPEMAAMVGLPTKAVHEPGVIIPYPARKPGEETPERKFCWTETVAGLSNSVRFPHGAASLYKTNQGLTACTGDKTLVGQNVIFQHEGDIESSVNLQHNCYSGKCGPHNSASVLQEREATTITRARIKHTDDQICAAVPTSLRPQSFTVADQDALRIAAAAQIHEKNSDDGFDDPVCPVAEILGQEHGGESPIMDLHEIPDGEMDVQPAPVAVKATVLENPMFYRVGVSRARKPQPLKQAPSRL
ncbi:hypothetical protein B0H10DRAFT_1945050 [Mycena sp. CBHHK59/15]|nr:hypothetical protein B0H10DRAFT_1945050 [Mycena sp. CBHHK59/15]